MEMGRGEEKEMVGTALLIRPTSGSLGFAAILRKKKNKDPPTLGEWAACGEAGLSDGVGWAGSSLHLWCLFPAAVPL